MARRRWCGRSCPAQLDDFQGWLIDQRTAADPSVIFAIFDAFRAFADWLVRRSSTCSEWLTWVGMIARPC